MSASRTVAGQFIRPARGPSPLRRLQPGAAVGTPVRAVDRWALRLLQRPFTDTAIQFALWDGTSAGPPDDDAAASVVIGDRPTLFRLLWDPEMTFGDGYAAGTVHVHGDLMTLLEAAYRAFPASKTHWAEPSRSNSRPRAHENIHHHYDLGNEFYRLWLDDRLIYTCAYFETPDSTLERAQQAKLDYICRKLGLKPGDHVVEAGCGWGSLAIHMASRYGVRVRAYNISREQIMYARARAGREGLGDRVEFVEDDYRNIQGTFDVFVSVGMVEHVGRDRYRELGVVIDRSLDRSRGRGLLHFIGRNAPQELSAWIRKRIFPGAYPPTLAEVTHGVLEPWNLSVLDIENLRLHYATTLEHWLQRFDQSSDDILASFDPAFVRAWRLYLAGSLAGFRLGTLQLFQVTFSRGCCNEIPWTRAALYGPEPGEGGL